MATLTRRAFGGLATKSVAAVAAVAIPAVALASEPTSADAALVALGEQLEAAWAATTAADEKYRDDLSPEAEAITEASYEAAAAIVHQIETVPASTIDGLRVKARAIQWCYDIDPVDLVIDQNTTDLRIANSIIRDLLAA